MSGKEFLHPSPEIHLVFRAKESMTFVGKDHLSDRQVFIPHGRYDLGGPTISTPQT
jgi:hypothetical protein